LDDSLAFPEAATVVAGSPAAAADNATEYPALFGEPLTQ
jgi:hypothetical protein